MKLTLTLFLLFTLAAIFGQVKIDSLHVSNPILNIGQKITEQGSVRWSKCNYVGFKYVPAETDSILIHGIAFGKVIATVNKHNKIERVSFSRLYAGEDSNYLNEILIKDFDAVTSWITDIFSHGQQSRGREYGDTRIWNKATNWVIKRRKIRVVQSYGQIRAGGKLYHSLVLEFF